MAVREVRFGFELGEQRSSSYVFSLSSLLDMASSVCPTKTWY